MTTPKKVLKEWESIPSKKRTGRLAKKYAAKCGMKSMGEVKLAIKLQDLKREKKIKKFEYEAETFAYQFKPQKYTPDFKVTLKNGDTIYLEYKGKLSAPVRKKMRAVRDCNEDKELYMIFERGANKLSRSSNTTYLEWAAKNKIPSSDGEIEEDWLKLGDK